MVAKTLQKYNQIDVLVNNPGYSIKDDLLYVRFDENIVADGNKEVSEIKLASAFKELRNLIHAKKTEAFSR